MYNNSELGGFMEITWYGHSCFRLTQQGLASVVIDPYDHREVGFEALKLKADIVTISHNMPGHNFLSAVKGDPYIVKAPGEYEIGGVFITAVQTHFPGKRSGEDDELPNLLCMIDYFGITVAHLGGLNRVPSQSEVEALGPVHIAMVPVGGGTSLGAAKAAEVVSLIEPSYVIPMHYFVPGSITKLDPLKKFLKELGQADITPQPSLKIKSTGDLPEETNVIVLDYPHS
jgi:L-ascorbate metabolism protein UlaG (beta-lactamase superfamily)